MKVLIPTAPAGSETKGLRRTLDTLSGKVVGFIDNAKPNANHLIDDLGELLVREHGVTEVLKRRKSKPFAPGDEIVEELQSKCDAIIVGVGDCGGCTVWTVHDSVSSAKAGLPAIEICSKAYVQLARQQAKTKGFAGLPLAIVPHPFGGQSRDQIRAIARSAVDDIINLLLKADPQQYASSVDAGTAVSPADAIDVPDDIEEFNRFFFEQRWSDGLPVIPPTPERVERMLQHTRRSPQDIVASITPNFGGATVEHIAISAVMAGCYPEYLPILIAAAEAMGDKQFNLPFVLATTIPSTTWLIINGPITERLDINGSWDCLGPGNWANATLGRGLRLISWNVCGGHAYKAAQGLPNRFLMCCAENEAENPWEPLHVERGFKRSDSTVTVVSARRGAMSFMTVARDAEDLAKSIGNTMMYPASSDYRSGGMPWLVLGPEHAKIFADGGLNKAALKQLLWEKSKMPASMMAANDRSRSQNARKAELGEFGPDTLLPISVTPDDINILVAGGQGMHSTYVPMSANARAVTRAIEER